MSRNSYIRTGLLATHPAFDWNYAALVCPLCFGSSLEPFVTLRVAEYDRHFLAHKPTQEQCEKHLSGKKYEKVCAQRGWDADDARTP